VDQPYADLLAIWLDLTERTNLLAASHKTFVEHADDTGLVHHVHDPWLPQAGRLARVKRRGVWVLPLRRWAAERDRLGHLSVLERNARWKKCEDDAAKAQQAARAAGAYEARLLEEWKAERREGLACPECANPYVDALGLCIGCGKLNVQLVEPVIHSSDPPQDSCAFA
jgi:hypothetical protein